jgi:hypothetical protein
LLINSSPATTTTTTITTVFTRLPKLLDIPTISGPTA